MFSLEPRSNSAVGVIIERVTPHYSFGQGRDSAHPYRIRLRRLTFIGPVRGISARGRMTTESEL